ncbi:hypothetical protein ABCS02_09790 [Microbacterium sp. X-17]|uniref:hypothetical protein n=1 Tax=Microbacterium sp. X-17 TaxID=3144404 RepID=UPI0031F47D7C
MVSVRTVLTVIGLAFTAYLAARGLWWSGPVATPWLMVAAVLFYLAVSWLWIFWGWQPRRSSPPPPVPVWGVVLALAAAALVPNAAFASVSADVFRAPYVTWMIGGIGALMTIVMVRGRPIIAWIGMAMLCASCILWIGVLDTLSLGLIGSVVWVVVAQLALIFLQRAARDTARLTELQQAASSWQAVHASRALERRAQVRRALVEAGPLLSKTIAMGGALTSEDRDAAQHAEWRLRDELRAPRLLDDAVRDAVDALRRRGSTVTVLDEGGLDDIEDAALLGIRHQLADALRSATSPRIFVRTSPNARVAVTIVGRAASSDGLTDEDAVELWREISRPQS